MKHRSPPPQASLRALPGLVVASALLLAACGHDPAPAPAPSGSPAGVSDTAGSDAGTSVDPSAAVAPAPAPADVPPAVPPAVPSPVGTPPIAPVVTASAGTAAPGSRVLSLSFATADATGYRIDWKGVRSGTPIGAPLFDGLTVTTKDVRVPAWWDAADALQVSACNAQGCTPAAAPGVAVGTVPGPVVVTPPVAGIGNGTGAFEILSADGRVIAVQARYGNASEPLRLYVRASETAGWTLAAALPRPADADSGFWGSWSMSLSADGSRLAVGDPNAGVSNNRGGFWLVLDPTGSSPTTIFVPEPGGSQTALGTVVSLSEDGTTLAVLAPDAAGKILVYDLAGVGPASTTLPAPTVVPTPTGMAITINTNLRLSGDGRALFLAGKASATEDEVHAVIDLAGPLQVAAMPLAQAPAGASHARPALAVSRDGATAVFEPFFIDFGAFPPAMDRKVQSLTCTTSAPRSCSTPGAPLYTFTGQTSMPENIQQAIALDPQARTLVVGRGRDAGGDGAVDVYARSTATGGWVLARTLAGSNGERFGTAVSISGEQRIAIGRPLAGNADGAVWVY